MSKSILIIDSGNRSWFERILAAAFYTCAFFLIIKFFTNVNPEFAERYYVRTLKLVSSLIFILTLAVYYSLTKNFHFDLISNNYRAYYQIGPFGFGKWEKHLEFKSVIIYLNSNEYYLVNIWDVKNNRITVGTFSDLKKANKFGVLPSEQLNLKFKERKN